MNTRFIGSLHCVAVLQCVGVSCSELQYAAVFGCRVSQSFAECCSVSARMDTHCIGEDTLC